MKFFIIALFFLISVNTFANDWVVSKVYEDSTHTCFSSTYNKTMRSNENSIFCVNKKTEEEKQKVALEIELLKLQIAKETKKK